MFCSYCQTSLSENGARCPTCGAPPPSRGKEQNNLAGSAGQPPLSQPLQQGPQSLRQWRNSLQPQAEQSLPQPVAPFAQQVPPQLWEHSPVQQAPPQQPSPEQQQGMLLVPYQSGMQLQTALAANPTQMIPLQMINQMLPALPEADGGMIYVPPMYTKPRAIIPKYRAISGLLIVIIVSLLVCAAAGYLANTSGWTHRMLVATGIIVPQSIQPTAVPNFVAPQQNLRGQAPAADIIPSAALTLNIDPQTGVAREVTNHFQVNELFYLTYAIATPNSNGKVIIKWYTNNNLFTTIISDPIAAGSSNKNGSTQMRYVTPTAGKVEMWWNDKNDDQLAQTLF